MSTGTRSSNACTIVPLPAPEGPVITKTRRLAVAEASQLLPLTVGQPADRLRLADPALCEQARRLHATELGDGHEHVEHLRGRHVLGRIAKDLVDRDVARLEIFLELGPLYPDVVGP